MAFNRPTDGSPPYTTWYNYKPVDGHYSGLQNATDEYLAQTCFAGQGGTLSWWKVDLGLQFNVLDVFYYGRNIELICKFYSMNTKHFTFV